MSARRRTSQKAVVYAASTRPAGAHPAHDRGDRVGGDVSTSTETEALLLEANLISSSGRASTCSSATTSRFLHLITGDHWAPQILKHRGAQSRPGRYFGRLPRGRVNRTITALQRAFLIRSCTTLFESAPPACSTRSAAAPALHREIDFPAIRAGARGHRLPVRRSHLVKQELAAEMEKASSELEFETAALYRDRLAALSAIQSQQASIRAPWRRPTCSPSTRRAAILRRGVLLPHRPELGNRAYFPRGRILHARGVLPVPGTVLRRQAAAKTILLSHAIEECDLPRRRALSVKAASRSKSRAQARREEELIAHALTNAASAGAQARDTATQGRCWKAWPQRFNAHRRSDRGLRQPANPGHQRGRRDDRGGTRWFHQEQYRKSTSSRRLTPGDDYAMMREVLQRRFKRLLAPPRRAIGRGESEGRHDAAMRRSIDGGIAASAAPHRLASGAPAAA